MKNLIWIFACIMLCASLSSCSNDKDSIAGLWYEKQGNMTFWFKMDGKGICSYTKTEKGETPYDNLWSDYQYILQGDSRIEICEIFGIGTPPEYETWLEGTYTDTEILLSNDKQSFILKKLK